MTRRPWRVEYEDAEGIWRIASTFSNRDHALADVERQKRENPGVQYRLADNVHLEAHKEDV